jgi:phospholipid/cholesterol/gamma-HCH transport system substrate-binding protein
MKALGFFFVVIVTILVFVTVIIQKVEFFTKPIEVKVHFEKSVEGLRSGDDVRVEGIVFGKVKRLDLHEHGGVVVLVSLNRAIELREGYEITVEAFTILGGNFVSIRRGKPDAPVVDLTQTLVGRTKPSAFDQLGDLVSTNRDALKTLIQNAGESFGEVKQIAKSINEGQGTIGALVKDRALYDKATATIDEVKAAIEEMRTFAKKLERTDNTLGKLFSTTELHDELTKTLQDVRKNVNDAVGELKDLAQKAKDPNAGPIGALMSDTEMREDLKKTTTSVKKIAQDLEKISTQISEGKGSVGKLIMEDKLYQDAEKTLGAVDNVLGRAGRSKVHIYAEGASFPESEMSIARLGLRIWPDDTKYFFAGGSFISLSADGDKVRFEKQLEENEDDTIIKFEAGIMYRVPWFLDKNLGVKVGLIDGKPGGGIVFDYELFQGYPIHAEFEIRDAYNDLDDEDFDEEVRGPMTRLWVKLPLWKRGTEWYEQIFSSLKVFGGVSRLQDDPEFFIGFGLEYRDEDVKALVGLLSAGR